MIRRPVLSLSKEFFVKLIDDLVYGSVKLSICSDTLSMLLTSYVVLVLPFVVLLVAYEAGYMLWGWDRRVDFVAGLFLLLHTLSAVLMVPRRVLLDIFCVMLELFQV